MSVVRLGIATDRTRCHDLQPVRQVVGLFSLLDLQLLNFLTLVTEFAAIARPAAPKSSPLVGVPIAACALTLLVLTGSYRRWERIVVFLCLLDLAWFALAFYSHPAAGEVARNTFVPSIPAGGLTASLVFLVVGIVGTTIAPWQLFFQQSCVADKRLRFADLKWARLDTLIDVESIAGRSVARSLRPGSRPAQLAADRNRFGRRIFD